MVMFVTVVDWQMNDLLKAIRGEAPERAYAELPPIVIYERVTVPLDVVDTSDWMWWSVSSSAMENPLMYSEPFMTVKRFADVVRLGRKVIVSDRAVSQTEVALNVIDNVSLL